MRLTIANVLSIASHDLKTPLAAVQGYLGVILGGFAGEITDKQREMIDKPVTLVGLLVRVERLLRKVGS